MDIEAKVIIFYYDFDESSHLTCCNDDGIKIHIEENWVGIESSDGVTMVNTDSVKYFTIDK